MKNKKSFSVTCNLDIDEDNNILGSHEESHSEDIHDMLVDTVYDIDDVSMTNLIVKEKNI
tara:strand:+ start:509 stop:688 length:180 start_codon:yes stop_codon:yes gene_type:complete